MSSKRRAKAWQPRSDTWREAGVLCVWGGKTRRVRPPVSPYLSQLAFEQRHVRGGREDDVLTRRQSVHEAQASGPGLCDQSPKLA